MSVLVRSPSATRNSFLEASVHAIGSSEDSPWSPPGILLADLPTSLPQGATNFSNRSRACPYFVVSIVIALGGAGIFNLLSIAYAFLPRLRDRLTQGRRALPWKPWVFGEGDSHPLYRLLMPCIITRIRSSAPHGTPSMQIRRSPTAQNN